MVQQYNGRSLEKPIDWDVVDKLLEAGCTGADIAPVFGVHPETLYDRAYKDFGIMWTHYSQKKHQKGINSIRVKQFEKAMKGDNSMLIWLGKNRLKQSDTPRETELAEQTIASFKDLMQQISIMKNEESVTIEVKAQSLDLKIEDNSIINAI